MIKPYLPKFILFLVLSFFCIEKAYSQVIKSLPLNEFVKTYTSTNKAQLLDVRTPGEWKNGKINSATLIDFRAADFSQKINKMDKTRPIFVYCAVGERSKRASAVLAKAGFKVFNLSHAGYPELVSAGIR